jgi:hypothetical protein
MFVEFDRMVHEKERHLMGETQRLSDAVKATAGRDGLSAVGVEDPLPSISDALDGMDFIQ